MCGVVSDYFVYGGFNCVGVGDLFYVVFFDDDFGVVIFGIDDFK